MVENAQVNKARRESLLRRGFDERSISIVDDAARYEEEHSITELDGADDYAGAEDDAAETGDIELKDRPTASL